MRRILLLIFMVAAWTSHAATISSDQKKLDEISGAMYYSTKMLDADAEYLRQFANKEQNQLLDRISSQGGFIEPSDFAEISEFISIIYEKSRECDSPGYRLSLLGSISGRRFWYDYEGSDSVLSILKKNIHTYVTDSVELKGWELVLKHAQPEYLIGIQEKENFEAIRNIRRFIQTKPKIGDDVSLLLHSIVTLSCAGGTFALGRDELERYVKSAKQFAKRVYPDNWEIICGDFEFCRLMSVLLIDPQNSLIEASRLERMILSHQLSESNAAMAYLVLSSRAMEVDGVGSENEYSNHASEITSKMAQEISRPCIVVSDVYGDNLMKPELASAQGEAGMTAELYDELFSKFGQSVYARRCAGMAMSNFLNYRVGQSKEVSNLQIARDYYNLVKEDSYDEYRIRSIISAGHMIALAGQVEEGRNLLKMENLTPRQELAAAMTDMDIMAALSKEPESVIDAAQRVVDLYGKCNFTEDRHLLDAYGFLLFGEGMRGNYSAFDNYATKHSALRKRLGYEDWQLESDWDIAYFNALRIPDIKKRISKLKDLLSMAEKEGYAEKAVLYSRQLGQNYFQLNDKSKTREMYELAIEYSAYTNVGIDFSLYNDYLGFLYNFDSDRSQWRLVLNRLIRTAEDFRLDVSFPFLGLLSDQINNAINTSNLEDAMLLISVLFSKANHIAALSKGDTYAMQITYQITFPLVVKFVEIFHTLMKNAPTITFDAMKLQFDQAADQYKTIRDANPLMWQVNEALTKYDYIGLQSQRALGDYFVDGEDAAKCILDTLKQWAIDNDALQTFESSTIGLRQRMAIEHQDFDELEKLIDTPHFQEMAESGNISIDNLSSNYSVLERIHMSRGDYSRAQELEIKRQKAVQDYINSEFINLSESQRAALFDNGTIATAFLNEMVRKNPNKENLTWAYNSALFYKNLLLGSAQSIQRAVYASGDSVQIADYERMLGLRSELRKKQADINSTSDGSASFSDLLRQAKELEDSISVRAADAGLLQGTRSYTFSDVAKSLADDEAAIEFVVDGEGYGALIMRRKAKQPIYVPLVSEEELSKIIDIYDGRGGSNLHGAIARAYSRSKSQGKKSYDQLWAPIESHLQGVQRIFYTPEGTLHRVPFAALEDSTRTCLCEKYDMRLVSSTAQVVSQRSSKSSKTNPIKCLAFGGVKYDTDSAKDPNRKNAWHYLESTPTEVAAFDSICALAGLSSTLFMEDKPTEELFRSFSGASPDVLLLATHGFYFDNEKAAVLPYYIGKGLTSEENRNYGILPMMRGGIILANANPVWLNEVTCEDKSDGVLTGSEISELNLSDTKLLILSACDTGRGATAALLGVNGLQRGFKLAGVQSIVMSLWEVSDVVGMEFMKKFYARLFSGEERHEAFRAAQTELKSRYPRQPGLWAPFVMLD